MQNANRYKAVKMSFPDKKNRQWVVVDLHSGAQVKRFIREDAARAAADDMGPVGRKARNAAVYGDDND